MYNVKDARMGRLAPNLMFGREHLVCTYIGRKKEIIKNPV